MTIIAKEEQILAQPGDVFGIHYPKGASDGCVPYYNSGAPLCCGMNSSDLSRFHNAGLWNDTLPVGRVINIVMPHIKRLPALKPVLEGEFDGLV